MLESSAEKDYIYGAWPYVSHKGNLVCLLSNNMFRYIITIFWHFQWFIFWVQMHMAEGSLVGTFSMPCWPQNLWFCKGASLFCSIKCSVILVMFHWFGLQYTLMLHVRCTIISLYDFPRTSLEVNLLTCSMWDLPPDFVCLCSLVDILSRKFGN